MGSPVPTTVLPGGRLANCGQLARLLLLVLLHDVLVVGTHCLIAL